MNSYLSYRIPKYSEIVQIVLMILGRKKEEINLPRSNALDCRKCLRKQFIETMMNQLESYQLRRQSSETVDPQYKINKLLERCICFDIQWKKWMLRLLENIVVGFLDFILLPKVYFGPEFKEGMQRYRLINLELRRSMIEKQRQSNMTKTLRRQSSRQSHREQSRLHTTKRNG